ncbi:MAG: HAMP domain-containing sensor histidine kinase [Burkholderiaceae bacterium]|nr:HAMP domain-containing sensor histidine kinase [Burkholderiaceae bacterium]
MLPRLPYRIQIPLGLALAVTLSVLLVSVVAAQISARAARQDIVTTVQRVVALLVAQGRPLLATEDTWRAFELLRNTAMLLPDAGKGYTRAAILDADGRFLAGSDPQRLPTGEQALGVSITGRLLPFAKDVPSTRLMNSTDGSLALIQPIRSDDEKVIGFVFAEVDAAAFAPDWGALAMPALIGAALAVIVLVPLGWLAGRRMAQPIAQMANSIALIGRVDLAKLQDLIPQVRDPELNRISGALRRLLDEMSLRQANEQRALSAERLAAVGRITAAVAHEINNPLAGLLTATRTLRLHGDAPATRLRTVDLIERGLHQIRTMTAALLPQARVEDRCMTATDLDDVITLARATATLHSVMVTSVLANDADMCVPSSVFRQVMLNLLLNAIKAAGNGGQVHAHLAADAQTVRFTVANTGQVLTSDELQQRLQADDSNDPHGFGLWICQEFAVRYGGGFAATEPGAIAQPFSTSLSFWLPNQTHHDNKKSAAD